MRLVWSRFSFPCVGRAAPCAVPELRQPLVSAAANRDRTELRSFQLTSCAVEGVRSGVPNFLPTAKSQVVHPEPWVEDQKRNFCNSSVLSVP